jgi:UDP-N-acetyl-D-glucosamine dehydrogenase
MAGRKSLPLDAATVKAHDLVLICTNHDNVDYGLISSASDLVVDTRNAMKGLSVANVVLA